MEQFTLVLVVLFCSFFIGCPVVGALTSQRRRKANAADPGPGDLYRARRKLSTVTTYSAVNNVSGCDGEHAIADRSYYLRPRWLLLLPASFGRFYRRSPASGVKGSEGGQQMRDWDTEANATQLELGECPICIGPLVPEPVYVEDGLNAREILSQFTTIASTTGGTTTTSPVAAPAEPGKQAAAASASECTADAGPGEASTSLSSPRLTPAQPVQDSKVVFHQQQQGSAAAPGPHIVGPGDNDITCIAPNEEDDHHSKDKSSSTVSKGHSWSRYRRQWSDRVNAQARAGEDDILRLNICGHAFHAKCLASWFLINRYDCPVCRAIYYVKKKPSLPKRVIVAALPSMPQPERRAVPRV